MFGLGKKKNGFFAELKEGAADLQKNVTEGVAELQENVTEGAAELKENVTEGVSELQENVTEEAAELKGNVTEGVAELKDSQTKKTKTEKSTQQQVKTQTKATTPTSESDRIAQLISSAVQGNNSNNKVEAESESSDAVGFASKNFILAATPRRRPGANMTMFKEMASQAKVPRN
ncbi:MAG: hypothetical protein WA865_09275 [Spirulinaceae cyanobacterium]